MGAYAIGGPLKSAWWAPRRFPPTYGMHGLGLEPSDGPKIAIGLALTVGLVWLATKVFG